MKFKYKLQKADGSFAEGEREALSQETLVDMLRAEGGVPVWVQEIPVRRTLALGRLFSFSLVPQREKVAFVKNVGAMLGAGLSLSRALEVLVRQSGNAAFRKVLLGVGDEVRKGQPLSAALRRFPRVFPPIFSAMVAAGEEGGSLSRSLASLTEQLERSYALGRKLFGALIYPALIVVVMIAIAILMLLYVVPQLSLTFGEFGVPLPASTRALIATSNLLTHHLFLFLSVLLLISGSVILFSRTRIGGRFFDFLALHLPVVRTMVRELNSARTARSLGTLSAAGVPLVTALGIVGNVVQNSFYRDTLRAVQGGLERGETLSSGFAAARTLYEPYFTEMVASGEETGKLSSMLSEAALFYESEVEQKTKNFSSVIEPMLMVAVGIATGFFAYSLILPMYTLMNNV